MSILEFSNPARPHRRRAIDLDVAIVGGGISGLATAHRLAKRAGTRRELKVALFESSERLGGLVETQSHRDRIFEAGPDSIVTAKPAAYDLCHELGLGDALIAPSSKATFSIVHERRLHALPDGFRMIAPTATRPLLRSSLFSWPGKLRILLEPWAEAFAGGTRKDESVEAFVVRRLGREAYDRLAEPLLGGLYVSDASTLSAQRVLAPMVALERRHGSIVRGLRASVAEQARSGTQPPPPPPQLTLATGLGSLVERLVDAIPASWLRLGCDIKAIQKPIGDKGWQIESTTGNFEAREIVLACPAPRCHDLLRESIPVVARAFKSLRFGSCVTVNGVYRRSDLPSLPHDFGFFVPRAEPFHILAASFSSEKFPGRAPANEVIIKTFQGGSLDPDALELDDDTLVERSHRDLAALIGARRPPREHRVSRFRQSMPRFDVGHLDRVARLQKLLARELGLHVVGSGVGSYGLPDCVASAEQAAAEVARFVDTADSRRPTGS
jgi:oxygen-dependent protoporphyrinogen oxidase